MYVIRIYRNGEWVAWTSTANPAIVDQYLQLLGVLHPGIPFAVDPPSKG